MCLGVFYPGHEEEVGLAVLDPSSRMPALRTALRGVDIGSHVLASSQEEGLLFVLVRSETETPVLMAFDAQLRQVWSHAHPGLSHLLTDAQDRHVAVVYSLSLGPWLCRLGSHAPRPPEDSFEDRKDRENVYAAIAHSMSASTPAERFERLDQPCVWEWCEPESMSRLAEAALQWEEGPWTRRMFSLAAYVTEWRRREKDGEPKAYEDDPKARIPELRALAERAAAWLDDQLPREQGRSTRAAEGER